MNYKYNDWLKSLKVGDNVALEIDYGDHFESIYKYRKFYKIHKIRSIEYDKVYITYEYHPFINGILNGEKLGFDDHILKILPITVKIQEWIEKDKLKSYLSSSEFQYDVIPTLSLDQLKAIKNIINQEKSK